MFQLIEEESNKFSWDMVGSTVSIGRENLGESMPVFVYRLFQYTIKDAIQSKYGKEEMIEIFRNAGLMSGKEFANNMLDLSLPFEDFIASLREVLEASKIGVLRIEKYDKDTGNATITIGEDLDCSGLPVTGETVCNYDEGFLKGILEEYTKKNYDVTEVDCWATGARVCRFEAIVTE